MQVNVSKFKYRLTEVTYAGHMLSQRGLREDWKKIEAVTEMERPGDLSGIRRFLGMANFLGKFIKDLADICEPLRQLTKQDVEWQWAHEQERAFQNVKKALISSPVFIFFGFFYPAAPVTIQCDAPQKGLGACLMQRNRVVA